MPAHIEFGKKGEALAISWLEKNGFRILARNWRHGRLEVDVIASRNDLLHFIEIKSRRGNRFGQPEESVDEKKLNNMMSAGDEYQYQHPEWERIQFDILSISQRNSFTEYFLIEDVYL
jgi:putative endonuclease